MKLEKFKHTKKQNSFKISNTFCKFKRTFYKFNTVFPQKLNNIRIFYSQLFCFQNNQNKLHKEAKKTEIIIKEQHKNKNVIFQKNSCLKPEEKLKKNYFLEVFKRSNQDTCLNHKPLVTENTWVQSGDALTDCASSVGGELSLGQNLLIAYMPWEGYNFEDAILISERLVKDDLYTSVHIERYELQTQQTKLGLEEITRHIADVSEQEIKQLDSFGIIKIGSWVEEGDILVGKTTPLIKKKISCYQKLLYAILEKQVILVKDSSLRAPKGIKAKVIDVKYFLKPTFKENVNFINYEPIVFNTETATHPFGVQKTKQKIKFNFNTIQCVQSNKKLNRKNKNQQLVFQKFFLHQQISKKSTQFKLYRVSINNLLSIAWWRFLKNKKNLKEKYTPYPFGVHPPTLRAFANPGGAFANFKEISCLLTKPNRKFGLLGTKKRNLLNLLKNTKQNQNQFKNVKHQTQNKSLQNFLIKKIHSSFYTKQNQTNQFKLQIQQYLKNVHCIHVYLAEKRKVQVGDKMAGRHGNKGIISQILPIQDMPFLPDGTPIDMVLNPLGVPSRMNVGQIYECLLGLAGHYLGENYKVSAFDEIYGPEASRSFVLNKLKEAQLKTGKKWLFNANSPGKVRLLDGRNGEFFDQKVTVGKAYMLRLVHMVDDKIHMRSTGPYSLVTQQPLRGRSKQGGQRLGEMEVWALEGYGSAFTLLEMLTLKSDDMTGRMALWSNLILNKDVTIGTPESFKVLVCELQALCLDIALFRHDTYAQTKTMQKASLKETVNLIHLP